MRQKVGVEMPHFYYVIFTPFLLEIPKLLAGLPRSLSNLFLFDVCSITSLLNQSLVVLLLLFITLPRGQ